MEQSGLPDRIAGAITALIVAGDIAPNQHLGTQTLAMRFLVSRTPIRDALGILASRGLVEQRTNRGYFARTLSPTAKKLASRTARDAKSGVSAVYFAMAEDWLKDAIAEEVTENVLRKRYQLSKAQLTGILNRAASEGWIERKLGYGWRFLPVAKTPEAQEQLYRVRLLIEPAALLEPTFVVDRKAAEGMRDALQRIIDDNGASQPADRLHAIGVSFHEELMRMSGNPFLLQALVRVNHLRRLLEYRSMIDRQRVTAEAREHLEILRVVMTGDVVGASYLMRGHIAKALQRKRPLQSPGAGPAIGFTSI